MVNEGKLPVLTKEIKGKKKQVSKNNNSRNTTVTTLDA